MNSTQLQHALAAANHAADAAADVIKAHLSSGDWSVSYKADDSPVTEVDIATEKAIKTVLADYLSGAAFYGEETGRSESLLSTSSEHQQTVAGEDCLWLVDPIDGTKSFIRNMPFYSTQIALQVDGELCVGVSNAPAYGERLVAVKGQGVWLNEMAVSCRDTRKLGDVFLSSGNLTRLASNASAWQAYGALLQQVKRVRGYGDFCHYHQLCCGQTDLIIESDVNILDIAALTVAVREAGGVITDLQGQAITLETTSVLAAGTAQLHSEVLALLQPHFSV